MFKLPRGMMVDPMNLPKNFDEMISKSFSKFTEGTSHEYTFHDKLYFIDLVVRYLHGDIDSGVAVDERVKGFMEYTWDEEGRIPSENEIYCRDFMIDCYDRGQEDIRLYSKKYSENNYRVNDAVMKMLCRIIKIVMDW